MDIILHNLFSFLVIISIIVFVHEFGHYFIARVNGVKVETFSIGFGKEIFGFNDKVGTRWKFSLIPMGGYVKMFGDADAASSPDGEAAQAMTEDEKKVAFYHKGVWQRFAIVLAGPAINFILAIFILWIYYAIWGYPFSNSVVTEIVEDSAAQEAGLQLEDRITEINGSAVTNITEVREVVLIRPNEALSIKFERDGNEIESVITPREDNAGGFKKGIIGIKGEAADIVEVGIGGALAKGVYETYNVSKNTLIVLGQMITGKRSAQELSGIIRIADYSGKSVSIGIKAILWFMAILSINLGLINLFPIPTLDGGHLVFYLIEALKGSPVSIKAQEWSYRFGFAALISLMVFALVNDLRYFNVF